MTIVFVDAIGWQHGTARSRVVSNHFLRIDGIVAINLEASFCFISFLNVDDCFLACMRG